jgi:DNA-directed RNA polymerase beta subunit
MTASPHLDAYRALLTPDAMKSLLVDVLEDADLHDNHRVRVGTVSVRSSGTDPATALVRGQTLWHWIEAELSLIDGAGSVVKWTDGDQQKSTALMQFRAPSMTDDGTFVIDGMPYVPLVQLIPRPGLVARSYLTPSQLARIVRLDVLPERGSWFRVMARRELVRDERDSDVDDLSIYLRYTVVAESTEMAKKHRQVRRSKDVAIEDVISTPPEEWPAPLTSCRFAEEGRRRFNDTVKKLTDKEHPEGLPTLTVADLRALRACAIALVEEPDPSAPRLSEDLSDLANVRAVTIADQVRSCLRAALSVALVEARRAQEALAEAPGRRRRLQDQGEVLRIFSRFAAAATEPHSSVRDLHGQVQVPGTRRRVRSSFADRRLVQLLDDTNPLAKMSHQRKVTKHGPGGVNSTYGAHAERDLHPSHLGALCVFETPESQHIGLNLHLARSGSVRNGAIEVGPLNNGRWLGWGASLVPFLPHNDAARILMAAKNMKQAVPLRDPEPPLVRTGVERDSVTASRSVIAATASGVVRKVREDNKAGLWRITIDSKTDWGELARIDHDVPMLRPTLTGTPSGFDVLVRPGDAVEAGQTIAANPTVVDDELALGVNLRVGYMPFHGLNTEDGIAVSETAAKRLTSRHLVRIVVRLENDEVLMPGLREPAEGEWRPDRIDAWGIVRKGQYVFVGDEIVRSYALGRHYAGAAAFKEAANPPAEPATFAWNGEQYDFRRRAYYARPGETGEVHDVHVRGRHGRGAEVEIWLKSERPLRVGDKLMARHGNKGIVSAILPDSELPRVPDIGHLEAVLSPIGALTRLNIGQLIETHVGWVTRHGTDEIRKQLPAAWPALTRIDGKTLGDWLRQSNSVDETGKVHLVFPDGSETTLPVVVGYQYFMKLNHLADEKVAFRTVGRTGDLYGYGQSSLQPPRGRRQRGGQRLGEMEVWALRAWNVPELLAEAIGLRSDDLASRSGLQQQWHSWIVEPTTNAVTTHLTEAWRGFLALLLGVGLRARVFVTHRDGSEREVDWLAGAEDVSAGRLRIELALLDDAGLKELVLKQPTNSSLRVDPSLGLRTWAITESQTYEDVHHVTLSCGCQGREEEILMRTAEVSGASAETTARPSKTIRGPQQCRIHKAKASITSRRVERTPIRGGLLDEAIWRAVDESAPTRLALGVIDLRDLYVHPLSATPVRYVPIIAPRFRTNDITRRYQELLYWVTAPDRTEELQRDHEKALQGIERDGDENRGESAAIASKRAEILTRRLEVEKKRAAEARPHIEAILRNLVSTFVTALGGKQGFLRQRLLGKRVDLSGRAVIVPDPLLDLDTCGVPLEAGLDLADSSIRSALEAAVRKARPASSTLAAGLASSRFDNDDERSAWLKERGVSNRTLVATLPDDLSGQRTPVSEPEEGRTQARRQRTGRSRRSGRDPMARLTQAIDTARPSVETLVSDLIDRAREGMDVTIETWARTHGLDAAVLATHFGEPSHASAGSLLARLCNERLGSSVVLLNRAPSLHRYNMHAFRPRVRADHVIALHPALCGRFNADFDGDTMAIHVPAMQSVGGRAFDAMRPSRHLHSSAAGQPLVHIEQDALAGLGYLALHEPDRLAAIGIPEAGSSRPVQCDREALASLGPKIRHWAAKDPERVVDVMRAAFETATRVGLSIGWADIPNLRTPARSAEAWLDDSLEPGREPLALPILVGVGALRDPKKGLGIVAQLGSARGKFDKLSGGETDDVAACLKLGLNQAELVLTAHGGRKGLADKKLSTPVAGALTRELVWSAEGMRIEGDDCGSLAGIEPFDVPGGSLMGELWRRDRFTVTGKPKHIRSPLTCRYRARAAICRVCYGCDLSLQDRPADQRSPQDGWPVGLIAATTIGERGTQLAMRTFHSGGTTAVDLTSGLPRIRALLADQLVPVMVRDDADAWGGGSAGTTGSIVAKRLSSVSTPDGLVRAFFTEMYTSYKASDVDPRHFEVLLAALVQVTSADHYRFRSLREAARARIGALEEMAFGNVPGVLARTVASLKSQQSDATPAVDGVTLDRMLGRRRRVLARLESGPTKLP